MNGLVIALIGSYLSGMIIIIQLGCAGVTVSSQAPNQHAYYYYNYRRIHSLHLCIYMCNYTMYKYSVVVMILWAIVIGDHECSADCVKSNIHDGCVYVIRNLVVHWTCVYVYMYMLSQGT